MIHGRVNKKPRSLTHTRTVELTCFSAANDSFSEWPAPLKN